MDARPEAIADDPWHGCNPLDRDYLDDPYPAMNRLRETLPVSDTPLGTWRIARYDDVMEVLHDLPVGVRTTDGKMLGVDEERDGPREFMLVQDPPNHTRLRRLVSKAFTPRAVERLRVDIERIVDQCLDDVAARGEMDAIADLALPVPSTVICEMLGVPVTDRERFTVWTAEATHGLATLTAPDAVLERAALAAMQLAGYFVPLIEERRRNLGDDILSALIRAEEEGDRLSGTELISQSIGLLIAGFETTIGLIGNGIRALIRHPEELGKLRDDPSLIETAVDECLRFDGPIVMTMRILHEDAVIRGVPIAKDTQLWVMLGAANRDPRVFDDPDRFDVARTPNHHLAFGGGPHFCLGSHLATLEAQVAIGRLVARFDDLALATDTVEWGPRSSAFRARCPSRVAPAEPRTTPG